MTEQSAVRYERDADGIVTLTMDDPSASANTMNEAYKDAMKAAVDRLHDEKDDITGVVLTSAKKTFFAGGNLNMLQQATKADAQRMFDESMGIKADLRRLETLGKPVVSAIRTGPEMFLSDTSPVTIRPTMRSVKIDVSHVFAAACDTAASAPYFSSPSISSTVRPLSSGRLTG